MIVYDSSYSSWIIDPQATAIANRYCLEGVTCYSITFNNSGGGAGITIAPRIIYFKKGNETWGTPRLVTRIEGPIKTEEEIYLYPNPSNDIIQLKTAGIPFKQIQLFDIQGRMIRELNFQKQLNVSELKNGMYFVKLIGGDNTKILKLLKE